MSLQGQFLAQPLVAFPLELLGIGLEEVEDTLVEELAEYDKDEVLVARTEEYR